MGAGTGGKTGTGYWYNFCAASVGTVCTSDTGMNSSYDICPARWHLPTYSQFQSLANVVGTQQYIISLFSPVGGGYFHNGSNHSIDVNLGNYDIMGV